SLGGVPPMAGFMGKFWLFGAAIEAGYVWLAVIGVLNSAVSIYYYIRIVVYMWLKNEPTGSAPTTSATYALVLGCAVIATILIGAIMLLGGIGYAVDRWRGTSPWFLLGGLLLGIIVGFYELAKTVWHK